MTRTLSLLTLALFACLTGGCRVGMTALTYRPAQGPQGVTVHITTAQETFPGELLEVREAGIVVLAAQKLRFVPYTNVVSSKVEQTPSHYEISNRKIPKPEVLAHLRLLSRFPQGLTPELLRQLLEANGQTELAGANP